MVILLAGCCCTGGCVVPHVSSLVVQREPHRVEAYDAEDGLPIGDAHAAIIIHRTQTSGMCCAAHTFNHPPLVRVEPLDRLPELRYATLCIFVCPVAEVLPEYAGADVIVFKPGYRPALIHAANVTGLDRFPTGVALHRCDKSQTATLLEQEAASRAAELEYRDAIMRDLRRELDRCPRLRA